MVPSLVRQDSIKLFDQLTQTRSRKTRDRLIELHTNLARKVAHRWTGRCSEPYEDLFQLALIGLCKAVDRFDVGQGNAFSSFAVPYIQGEILHFLRDHWGCVKVSRRLIEFHGRVKRHQRILAKYGREMADSEVAALLGCPAEKWDLICRGMDRKPFLDIEEAHCTPAAPVFVADSDRDWQSHLYSRLQRIENPYREILIEAYLAGMSISQIAQRREANLSEVQILLQTALRLFASEEAAHV